MTIKFKTVRKFESFSKACLFARKAVIGLTVRKYELSWDPKDDTCELTIYGPHYVKKTWVA